MSLRQVAGQVMLRLLCIVGAVVLARADVTFRKEGRVVAPVAYGHLVFQMDREEAQRMFTAPANRLLEYFRRQVPEILRFYLKKGKLKTTVL